ncbi:hypothetical protein H4R18_001487 [Coemansia javaensis]|uniref:Uncharacterized protein n=1 Tax=Coemansia javaensis TaxID=2761396 RepID=A0A9W8HDL3_9FUNG|nr:hypothetical protein H4R18_001487 [Coemansia javaensis]
MLAAVRAGSWRARPTAALLARGLRTSRWAAKEEGSSSSSGQVDEADEGALEAGPQILGAESVAIKPSDGDEDEGRRRKSKGRGGKGAAAIGGYRQWLESEGKKYRGVVAGKTNYVGGGLGPFPLNRAFRPRAPLSDATREAIYRDYLADPERATPRVLGEKYSVAIKRVEAVIKLKAIEHHMVAHDGFRAQTKLTAGMEGIMGVAAKDAAPIREALATEYPRVSGPRFHAVPEGEAFGPADAAEVLGRRPYQEIMDRLAASRPYVVDYEGLDPKFAPRPERRLSRAEEARLQALGPVRDEVIEKNDALTSRKCKFVFTDISKSTSMKDRVVLVREKDGTLKRANRDYKLKRYGEMWFN